MASKMKTGGVRAAVAKREAAKRTPLNRALNSGVKVAQEGAKQVIADRANRASARAAVSGELADLRAQQSARYNKMMNAKPRAAAKAATGLGRAALNVAGRAGLVGAAGAAGAAIGTALYKKFGTAVLDKVAPVRDPTGKTKTKSRMPKPMSDAESRSTAFAVGKAATKGVPTRSAFGNAFASARKSGKSEFTFKGKKYNTKVK